MKLEIPVKVDFDDVQVMIDELKKIQTYKLFEEDDTVFVILDDVISILTKHIRATHNSSEFPNGWIPCSERLPSDEEYDETFTVTIQCEHYSGWDDYVTGYADWTPHGWDIQSYYIGQIKVIAWMPLPECYRGDENVK